MSFLHGNFKKELRRIANPETANQESCPNANQVPSDLNFHHKHYAEETFAPSPEFCANLEEDERFDFLLRMRKTMTEYFDNTAYANPFGLTNYDYKSIGQSRQKCLEKYKMKIRRENYVYMNDHPEIDAMIEALLRKMFKSQPEDPIRYAAEFFCMKQTSHEEHEKIIQRKNIIRYRKSKSKEFYMPKADPSVTVRKLNLGPLADPLQWTKESLETPQSEPVEKEHEEEVKPLKKKCCCACKPMQKIAQPAQQQIIPQVKKYETEQEQYAKEEEIVEFFEQGEEEASLGDYNEYEGTEASTVNGIEEQE